MAGMFDYFWAPDEGVDVEDIRELVPFVVEKAPSADPNEVRRALAQAVNRFLRDTGVWRREGAPAYASADEVRVGSGGCARVISVERVIRDSDDAVVFEAADPFRYQGQKFLRDDGSGVFTLTLSGAATGDVYTADLVLTTKLGSELCPSWVMQQYGEAIASKAAHEILMRGQIGVTAHIMEYRAAVQEIIGRRAMGGSAKASAGNALSASLERI